MEQPIISGIAFNRDEAKLTIRGVPDTPAWPSRSSGRSVPPMEVDMIVQNVAHDNTTDFTFTVHRNDYLNALEILKQTAANIGAREAIGDTNIAKVSIVGVGMRSHAGVASRMFEALAGKHQHPDDLHLGNQGFRGDRREVPGTGGTCPAHGVRARRAGATG